MKVVQNVLSLTQVLDLSRTSYLGIDLTCPDIKPKFWISFSSFIRSGRVLPQKIFSYGFSFWV